MMLRFRISPSKLSSVKPCMHLHKMSLKETQNITESMSILEKYFPIYGCCVAMVMACAQKVTTINNHKYVVIPTNKFHEPKLHESKIMLYVVAHVSR